ncbi:hypothetical protein [Streptomyces viridochromogenes]|uniref:hypothetical protein n=1 Tax=Streptomyces viridochromogenes TaxID=1938 RepID=UPI00131D8A9B|nr:hypothetical protein [Streptomyces viridochromogenes]
MHEMPKPKKKTAAKKAAKKQPAKKTTAKKTSGRRQPWAPTALVNVALALAYE